MGEALLAGKPDVIETDPFAVDPIQRDQYGRPLIIPIKKRGGQPDLKAKPVGYTRVSTFASSISDAQGLIGWRLRHLALGLGRNEELAAMAGVFGPTLNDCSRFDKAELDRIIETAHARSGGNVKADHGTAVHGMTEPDRDPFVPARMTADVESYHAKLAEYGIEVVSTEQFVVCDELRVAGTFDHLYWLTRAIAITDVDFLPAGTLIIGDKKTGALHLDSQSIQLAVYARGKLYDPVTGERTYHNATRYCGLLVHIPKGEGRTDLYLIDLVKGWAAAQLAGKVRAHRTDKTLGQEFPKPVRIIESVEVVSFGPVEENPWPVESIVPRIPVEDPFDSPVTPAEPENPAEEVAAAAVSTDADEAAVMAALNDIGAVQIVKPIFQRLNEATSRDELAQVWHDAKAECLEWTAAHTAVLQSRAKTIEHVK